MTIGDIAGMIGISISVGILFSHSLILYLSILISLFSHSLVSYIWSLSSCLLFECEKRTDEYEGERTRSPPLIATRIQPAISTSIRETPIGPINPNSVYTVFPLCKCPLSPRRAPIINIKRISFRPPPSCVVYIQITHASSHFPPHDSSYSPSSSHSILFFLWLIYSAILLLSSIEFCLALLDLN